MGSNDSGEELPCQGTATLDVGVAYVLKADKLNTRARTSVKMERMCSWSFDILPQVEVNIECTEFNVHCSNRLKKARVSHL